MAFPLKNLFGKKEEDESPAGGQLVAEPGSAFAETGTAGSGAFPPGQSPFQQAPPTAAQAQAPSSAAAQPPAFPDSAPVPLHASAKVAPAAATESPFISQPAQASAASEVEVEGSPFSAAPVSSPQVAPPAPDESPFGAPAGAEAVSSPFAAVEESPFAGKGAATSAAAPPEQVASTEAFPALGQSAPEADSASIESPFGAQDSSFSSEAPAAQASEVASPFAAESPFASMPTASGSFESPSSEPFPSADTAAPASPVAAPESPFALAGGEAAPALETAEPAPVTTPPEMVEQVTPPPPAETPHEEPDVSSPFAAISASEDSAPVEVELPLQLLIKPLGEDVLGFAPEKVPASVMTKVPLDLIKGQLSSGRVALPLGTVIEGCAPRFHKAFVRADRDAQLTVPIPDLYHHLPEGALAPVAPEPTFEPEPEPEEDLAAIFADEPEAEPEASFAEQPSPDAVAPEPVAPVAETPTSDEFASPFPPISSGAAEPVLEAEQAPPEMPTIEETSPAEVSQTSPFATPFTEAAVSEEVVSEEPEVEAQPEPDALVEPEALTSDEPASALPPFSPFSEEPLTSDDSPSTGLSLPSFFDIATPDDEASETASAAEEPKLEPFPEPTASSDKDDFSEPEIEAEPPAALPPMGPMIPAQNSEPSEDSIFATAPQEEIQQKPASNPLDAFAEDTTLSDIDSMDDLPELGDLDDLFPEEDPTESFVETTAEVEPAPELPVEKSPLEDVDPFADLDDVNSGEEPAASDVFSDGIAGKLPVLTPIAPVDASNVFDSAPEEPEENEAIAEPDAESLPLVAVADKELTVGEEESEDLSFGIHESEDSHQTALRALFGVEGTVDAGRAVDLAAALPGISACIFTGENSDAIGAGNLDSFATNGPAVFENVKGLVSAMGIDDAACFTIRTSTGTMSFFSEGETCLGVLHEEPRFEPGVREKLTIVARELDAAAPSPA